MRTLENRARGNLKCHFGGLAIAIDESGTTVRGKLDFQTNPKQAHYDVEAVRKDSYATAKELVYNRYGTGLGNQTNAQQSAGVTNKTPDPLTKARQKILDTLKASPDIAEASDLYPDSRYRGSAALGAFAPIYFVYRSLTKVQPQESEETPDGRYFLVYNGRFLIAAAFSEPDHGIAGLPEAVSDVSQLMSKSGYEFRLVSPVPTLQSCDLGGVSAASSPMAAALNDSIGGAGMTTRLFVRKPRSVQDSLRSLYSASFQHLMAFYSLREESDTQEAIFQTIEAHRGTVLNLMHEYNQTKRRQFLQRWRLRRLIRAHCFNLTEKIGRVDSISDSLALGIVSLETNLRSEPGLKLVLEKEPGWKSYLRHEYDTEPTLNMIGRTSEQISRPDAWFIVFLVILAAAAAGALVWSLLSGIL